MMKRILIAGALLLAFSTAVVAVPAAEDQKWSSKKSKKLFDKGMKAFQEKQTDQAIDLLNQVVVLEPANAIVRHNLGVLLHQKGMIDESIASFEEALRLDPKYQHSQLALRQSLFEAGKSASSKQEFEKANGYLLKLRDLPYAYVGKENDNILAMTRYLLGFNFFNLKQYPQAQANFELCQAMEGLEMENLDLYANSTYFLGLIGSIQKQFDESNYNFKKYLTLFVGMEKKPELYAQAHYLISVNLFQKLEAKLAKGEVTGMAEAATEIIPFLEQAIADKISSEDAHVMMGNCYVYMKEYDKAMAAYQQLCELFPQSPQLKNYQVFMGELKKMQQQAQPLKTKKKR